MKGVAGSRLPVVFLIGTLLLQAAWILAVPAFRGLDEIDHAYRAGSVALGHFQPEYSAAQNGRGDLIVVPEATVSAAQPVCDAYPYMGPDNCRPVRDVSRNTVLVASSASRYHPIFYWIVGKAASLFEGTAAFYAMRVTAALLCSAFIFLAAWAMSQWARTPWPYASLLVALTPVSFYSTGLAAPNGVEMCAALALWSTLLGLVRPGLSKNVISWLLVAAVLPLTVVTSVRQLGPLFAVLTAVIVLIVMGPNRFRTIATEHPRGLILLTLVGAVGSITNLWWITSASTLAVEQGMHKPDNPIAATFTLLPIWATQIIAVFPSRYEMAPGLVYVIWIVLFSALLMAALRLARGRALVGILTAALLTVLIPLGLTLLTIAEGGAIWQGRYGLPFSMGLPLLAGWWLNTHGAVGKLSSRAVLATAPLVALAHVLSVRAVVAREQITGPVRTSGEWLTILPWLQGLLGLAAITLCASGFVAAHTYRSTAETQLRRDIGGAGRARFSGSGVITNPVALPPRTRRAPRR